MTKKSLTRKKIKTFFPLYEVATAAVADNVKCHVKGSPGIFNAPAACSRFNFFGPTRNSASKGRRSNPVVDNTERRIRMTDNNRYLTTSERTAKMSQKKTITKRLMHIWCLGLQLYPEFSHFIYLFFLFSACLSLLR